MQKITPFLWFDKEAEEAARFYVSIFKNAKIGHVSRYGDAGPGPKGSVMTVSFELEGLSFTALNAGPVYHFTPAISFFVNCTTPSRSRRALGQALRRRRIPTMRLAHRQIRAFLADHPGDPDGADERPRSGEVAARHAGHAADDQDRHRQAEARPMLASGRAE